MIKNFRRLQHRKKRLRQALMLLILCFSLALGLVLVRSCSANMESTYNKGYQPMDTLRLEPGSPH